MEGTTRRFQELNMTSLPRLLVFALALGLTTAPVLVAAPNPTPSASPGLDLAGIDRAVRPARTSSPMRTAPG